jgi:hypothetical protein
MWMQTEEWQDEIEYSTFPAEYFETIVFACGKL